MTESAPSPESTPESTTTTQPTMNKKRAITLGIVSLAVAMICGALIQQAFNQMNPEINQFENTQDPYYDSQIGKKITVKGIAQNFKSGAALRVPKHQNLWMEKMSAWPNGTNGKSLEATGTVAKRNDAPVYIEDRINVQRNGIPVPPGTDLSRASLRYYLQNASFKPIAAIPTASDKKAAAGTTDKKPAKAPETVSPPEKPAPATKSN